VCEEEAEEGVLLVSGGRCMHAAGGPSYLGGLPPPDSIPCITGIFYRAFFESLMFLSFYFGASPTARQKGTDSYV